MYESIRFLILSFSLFFANFHHHLFVDVNASNTIALETFEFPLNKVVLDTKFSNFLQQD